jgi:hypothetical protein
MTASGYPTGRIGVTRAAWCRSRFLPFPLTLHFETSERSDWTQQQRAEELQRWSAIIARPDAMRIIMRGLLAELGDRLLQQSIGERRGRAELIAEGDRRLEESYRRWTEIVTEHERKLRESRDECRQWAEIVADRERRLSAVLASTSWRLTAPMRAAWSAIRRWRGR